jgi:hypothetical protein
MHTHIPWLSIDNFRLIIVDTVISFLLILHLIVILLFNILKAVIGITYVANNGLFNMFAVCLKEYIL